ncbi:MAG: SLC13 family permease, partial [Deltaproteobacteria bacterium]|nr:SLC13 family permease [Deltaproteobacteria bacterium]
MALACTAAALASSAAGLPWEAVLTAVSIAAALGAILRGLLPPDTALLSALIVLFASGVVDPGRALAGFANRGMLTVGALFMVAAGLRETGALSRLLPRILGSPRTERGALARLVPLATMTSAFLNNTTVVASLMPAVHDWGRRLGISPSRLLLPLSYAAII